MKVAGGIALLVLLGVAASSRWLAPGKEAESSVPASSRFAVARGPLRIVIEENGYLKAKENVSIKPKFKGQGTITWLIEEGKSVAPGDTLIEFDKTQLETQVVELENSLVQYQIELEAAKANLEIQERDNQASIEKAERGVEADRRRVVGVDVQAEDAPLAVGNVDERAHRDFPRGAVNEAQRRRQFRQVLDGALGGLDASARLLVPDAQALELAHQRVDLAVAQAEVVAEGAVRRIGVPWRHRARAHPLFDRTRPGPHVAVGEERHRRDFARTMAAGAFGEHDRRDVTRECRHGHVRGRTGVR